MQKIFFIPLLLLFPFFSHAQFGAVNYIDSLQAESVSQVKSADFNNDGLPDIVVSASRFPVDSMRIYSAIGNGQYSRQTIAAIQNTGDINCFDIADINNDGWMDIAIITHNATRLAWYENNNGVFTHHPLAANLDFTTQLLIKDFDRNGLQDILVLQHVEIVLYLQSSPGVFEAGRVVHSGTEFYAIDAGYYNKDSLPDISVASGGFEVLLNTGNGQFNLHSQAGLSLCFGLQSADLDNDSDIDIGMYESVRGILFYKNDGNGNFSFADTIVRSTDNFETFGFADFDCDNDMDLYTVIRQQGRVVWVENKLSNRFSQPKNIHVQTGQLIQGFCSADLNSDGKPDIVWGNRHVGINTNSIACPLCEFNFTSNISGTSYQWEVNNGNGFVAIANDAVYAGVNTAMLTLTAPPTNWYGYTYRCMVNNTIASELYALQFWANWTGAINTDWGNAANWACGILPDANTDVTIEGNATHYPQLNGNGFCRKLILLPGSRMLTATGAALSVTGK